MVYNSKDFEAFLLLYKAEGAPGNISIETFCKRNGINYEVFSKWYRSVHKQIFLIEIENAPEKFSDATPSHRDPKPAKTKCQHLKITIESEDGMTLSKQISSIDEACMMLKKLEGIVC